MNCSPFFVVFYDYEKGLVSYTSFILIFENKEVNMPRKRVERNISYDEERNRFYVTLQFGKDNNGRQLKQQKCCRTLKEAKHVLLVHEAARVSGPVIPASNDTLEEWMEYWLENIVRPNREETTYYAYRQIWKNHLILITDKTL